MYFDNDTKKSSPPRYTLPPINGSLHTPIPLSSFQSTQTFTYSPSFNSNENRREELYYPVYDKEWTEGFDNPRLKKKKDMDERMRRINQEFLDNRQVIYQEKLKQLENELQTVKNGIYDERIADLEAKRKKTIDDARLMMVYQISCVDHDFQLELKILQEESLTEKRELQNNMFLILEEKRKKLKQDKDDEVDFTVYETRNKKRLSRKRGELEQPMKRKQDHILLQYNYY